MANPWPTAEQRATITPEQIGKMTPMTLKSAPDPAIVLPDDEPAASAQPGGEQAKSLGGSIGSGVGSMVGSAFGPLGTAVGGVIGGSIGTMAASALRAPSAPGASIETASVGGGGMTGQDAAMSVSQSLQHLAMQGLQNMPAAQGNGKHF